MTRLRSFALTDVPDSFGQGARALRNARDWAKEKREETIAAANGKVPNVEHTGLDSSTQSFVTLSSDVPAHLESETSADELALDSGTCVGSTETAPKRARTNLSRITASKQRSKKKPIQVERAPSAGYRCLQEIKG